jgi:hypothetical protein
MLRVVGTASERRALVRGTSCVGQQNGSPDAAISERDVLPLRLKFLVKCMGSHILLQSASVSYSRLVPDSGRVKSFERVKFPDNGRFNP